MGWPGATCGVLHEELLRGNWQGKVLDYGSGSDGRKYWDARRAASIDTKAWIEVEAGIARRHGPCLTMGTAAPMVMGTPAFGEPVAEPDIF